MGQSFWPLGQKADIGSSVCCRKHHAENQRAERLFNRSRPFGRWARRLMLAVACVAGNTTRRIREQRLFNWSRAFGCWAKRLMLAVACVAETPRGESDTRDSLMCTTLSTVRAEDAVRRDETPGWRPWEFVRAYRERWHVWVLIREPRLFNIGQFFWPLGQKAVVWSSVCCRKHHAENQRAGRLCN